MSEYERGPLDALTRVFLKALRMGSFETWERSSLIREWNEVVKQLQEILMVR